MNKQFRKRFDSPRLSAEEAARQGRAAQLAWEKMPEPGAAVAFLNTHDEGLGGRPIDLAVASDAGLRAVEEAIAARDA
ncbi:antitoxin Xre/MbcA/ParS toxin-binding domain-containing protein [Sphingomonas gei]|uniref:antitoxin Xre/MbcA/ParS toxin-binding domain-containing protein n=1 Tax=Sphingomonas gei TaxID=1395960 RepID=UPI0014411AF5|nr:antitoxin Xre/MbcA/ParS toxin-binding domain-containing protein [Sphingomonas gei]